MRDIARRPNLMGMASSNVFEELGTQRTADAPEVAPAADSPPSAPLKNRFLDAFGRLTEKRRAADIERLRKSRGAVSEKLREIPERMQKLVNQMRLLLDLVDDYWTGRYRKVRWYSLAVAVLAMLYFLSPSDIVPDWLPILGKLDDVAAVAIALRLLNSDLRRYCEFRGVDPKDYF